MSLQPGTTLGPYEILSPLGAGGMGEVYKARDTRLDRTVAIKVLPEHVASDPDLKQRFEREAKTISSLNHPHICTLYDIGSQDGIDFLVMEYLEGDTLAQRLQKGALPLDQALQVAIEIADALDKAHRQGIFHRDLKPANVMLTKGGAKLLDFGLARRSQGGAVRVAPVTDPSESPTIEGRLTAKGSILGTVAYMSPEQIEGREADGRSDIWAFGCLLYEMFAGGPVFEGKSHAAVMAAILERDAPPLSQRLATSPPALDRIVNTCLEKDPEDRWQSSRDLWRELQWIGAERTAPAARGTSANGTLMTRRRWLALGGVAAGILALAIWFPTFGGGAAPAGPPVIVLMDSTHPLRIYDPATRAEGGTNADDLTNVLRSLPVVLVKENTSATWNREDEVLRQDPQLIVLHRSCFWDATPGGDRELGGITRPLAYDKFDMFIGYIGQGNPRTRFFVYSRGAWESDPQNQQRWVDSVEARFPALRGRVFTWQVPLDRATYRDPVTAAEIREEVVALLDLPPADEAGR